MLDTFVPILIFLLILSIVIFVHELGHYLAAVRAGIFVEEFAIGMGPKLFGFYGRKKSLVGKPKPKVKQGDPEIESMSRSHLCNEEEVQKTQEDSDDDFVLKRESTQTHESSDAEVKYVVFQVPEDNGENEKDGEYTLYSVRAFPIGGFCKMRGQDEDVPNDPEAMNNKSVFARLMVIAGGSFMNFLLAFLLFFTLVMLRGFMVAEVWALAEEMPGYQAGLMVGDRITHINGNRVMLYENFVFMMDVSGGQQINLRVLRDSRTYTFDLTPVRGQHGWLIGFAPGRRFGLLHERPEGFDFPFIRVGVMEGILTSAEMIVFHIRAPFRVFARFATGQAMPEGGGVMGPIGIGGMLTEIYQDVVVYGILDTVLTMVTFLALFSAMLGIMNLLPIPALDGARLVFLFIEAVRRKPVAPEKEAMVHIVGIVSLLMLAVFIAYRDIVRLL